MNRFRRPSLSESRPKINAPTICPIRYTVAIKPTDVDDIASVSLSARTPATELAMVISRPSKTHATPSAITILVWNETKAVGRFGRGRGFGTSTPVLLRW